jgi:hypothetical protein
MFEILSIGAPRSAHHADGRWNKQACGLEHDRFSEKTMLKQKMKRESDPIQVNLFGGHCHAID